MAFEYILPFVIPSILLYLTGISLFLYVLKIHLNNLKVQESQKKNFFTLKSKILILFFSIVFVSFFNGLYRNPFIDLIPEPSLTEVLLKSVIIGGLLYIIIYFLILYSIKYLKSFEKTLFKTRYTALILIIFVCFTIFSNQPTFILNNYEYTVDSNVIFSPDLSEIAYGVMSSTPTLYGQNLTHYLIITNLISKNSSIYPLGFESLIEFYNNSIIYQGSFSVGLFNLLTKKSSMIYSTYPYDPFYIKSGVIGTLNLPYSGDPTNTTELFIGDYIHHIYQDIPLTNFVNRDNKYINLDHPQWDISPDESKLVVVTGDYFNFYTLNKTASSLKKSFEVPILPNSINFNFIPWSDPSVFYFYNSNSTYTQLYSFNYTSLAFQKIVSVNKSIQITNINDKLSFFVTGFPVEIYSFTNHNLELLQNTSYRGSVWDSKSVNPIFYDFNKIVQFSFDIKSNSIHESQILYSSPLQSDFNFLDLIYNIDLVIDLILFIYLIILIRRENKR